MNKSETLNATLEIDKLIVTIENKTDCLLILHSICKKGHPLEHDLYSWEWEKFEALCVYIHSLEVKGKLKSVLSKDLVLK